jgi:ubiquinone/menaquinone biosynthesis C-methylase UbiE
MNLDEEAPLPLETLLRLPERGPAGLNDILRMAARADWRTRALSLSAAGRIAHADPLARRVHPFRHWVARRIPPLARQFPSAGYQGKYVRDHLANALVDRSWAVRTAAALALGECQCPSMIDALRPILAGPYRAERIAAAAAILSCGGSMAALSLAEACPSPARIGDATSAVGFLTLLAAGHAEVLSAWLKAPGADMPETTTPEGWAAFLAGPVPVERYAGPEAEMERYAADGETEYLLRKPFSRINRAQNVRLLHSFLVVAEQLRVPIEGRVLDLGGGSAWVSELLARFGLRPVTLDVSHALLRVGQRRFAREGLAARFTVGDMTRLPIASESMDAVVVMDALHHVPDVPAVFREVYRVLRPGGQFALAEPGEGHSDTEKSRAEMLEHGVQEREIHLFEAIGYGRDAGFDDIRAVPHYVPHVSMTPDDLKQAMKGSADTWTIRFDDSSGQFPQFVLQSMLDRPIVVFQKGKLRVDSRMPRTLKAGIAARLEREGARVRGTVAVENLGDTEWLAGRVETGYVRLGVQLLSVERHVIDMEFSRIALGSSVSPGGRATIDVALRLPDESTSYVLKLDLVDEGICWFEDVGSRPVYVAL